ncbi:MAG: hypothetical protein R3F61_27845 [Myxococcota bacterium]
MIFALATFASAHDLSPAILIPSVSPGDPEGEARIGVAYSALRGAEYGGSHLQGTVRLDRVAFGVDVGYGPAYPYGGSVWAGLALVDSRDVRLQVFAQAGGLLRPGVSFAAKTRRGGIGGQGYLFDLAWGPAFAVDRLVSESWAGPLDVLGSMPEGGVSMALHPAGTQFLRLGFVGSVPVASYRLDLRSARRSGFVLESTLGTNGVGGVVTISVGWSAGPRGSRAIGGATRRSGSPESPCTTTRSCDG